MQKNYTGRFVRRVNIIVETDKKDIAIRFDNVTKEYSLYKNDRKRLLGILFKKAVKHKTYRALDNVSFTIKKGESVGIIGRNGAGKSTILKIITGVAFPDTGKVTVNGQVSALLELTAGFDLEMTGKENIYLKGTILGLKKSDVDVLLNDIIEFADIGDYIDQPVRTYSSGMKSRLGFAINVNINPDILVIDEALSVGDSVFSEKCRQKIRSLVDSGTTVLFVSHSKDKIYEFCSRGLLMEKGKLLYDGEVSTAFQKYNALSTNLKKENK